MWTEKAIRAAWPRVGQRGDAASGTCSLIGVEVLEAADVEEEIEGAELVHRQVADIADHEGGSLDALTSRVIALAGGVVVPTTSQAAPDQFGGVLPAPQPKSRARPSGLVGSASSVSSRCANCDSRARCQSPDRGPGRRNAWGRDSTRRRIGTIVLGCLAPITLPFFGAARPPSSALLQPDGGGVRPRRGVAR